MNPETIITAEIISGLDECPFCEAAPYRVALEKSCAQFRCVTALHVGAPAGAGRTYLCQRREAENLRVRVKELETTNSTLHNLMASAEKRGVEKATEEFRARIVELESKLTEVEELHAFELSPAMVQARNDHLNDRVKQLEEALENAKADRNRAAQEERLKLLARIQRLAEAGDALMRDNNDVGNINRWWKAKEEVK